MNNMISLNEFQELGYLQEINRQFLHPLGLAMAVYTDAHGNVQFDKILNWREDLEGMSFAFEQFDLEIVKKKAEYIADEFIKRSTVRQESLGYIIQPIPEQ